MPPRCGASKKNAPIYCRNHACVPGIVPCLKIIPGGGIRGKTVKSVQIDRFISVGENIHCTRVYKVGGKYVKADADGGPAVLYKVGDEIRALPIPHHFTTNADWQAGKVKHCAVAVWQGLYGDSAGRAAGIDYVSRLAAMQEVAHASYLDINVDEFSVDMDERIKAMRWAVDVVQGATSLPISIDSSNIEVLRAGLRACDPARGRPMVNSVSLERPAAIDVTRESGGVMIVSAGGEKDLPSSTQARLANIERLMPKLRAAGFEPGALHVDPLVFPIAVDGTNGQKFLATVSELRRRYGEQIHIAGGLSNVSFGMPNRMLLNRVFTWLAVRAGADGGIVDPIQINLDVLQRLDPEDEAFKLAGDLLLGRDEFGMNYITASREGRI